ncbi:MAG: M48 family metallopeptidase [Bacteroidales bacterium]
MTYTLTRKQVVLPDIGTINIVKTRINRRITIRVTPRHVRVSIPYRVSFSEGENFLLKNIEWVRTKYNELKFKFNFYDQQVIETLFGKIHVYIDNREMQGFRLVQKPGRFYLYFTGDSTANEFQQYIHRHVMQLIRKQSLDYLSKRTEELAFRHRLSYQRLKLSSALSRWGSCSGSNSISLNYRLVFLPQALCDYVILHELAHTLHKNHSAAYWAFLSSMVPDYQARRQLLKQYRFANML